MLNYWRNKVDVVTTMDTDSRCDSLKDKEPHFRNRATRYPCFYTLFGKIIFDSDGNLKLCDQHYETDKGLGNIQTNTMKELYNSKIFNKLRELHMTGRKPNIKKCRECTTFYKNGGFDNPEFVYSYGWEK